MRPASRRKVPNKIGFNVASFGLALLSLTGCANGNTTIDTIYTPDPVVTSAQASRDPDFSPIGAVPAGYEDLAKASASELTEDQQLVYASFLEQNAVAADARYDEVAGGDVTPIVAPSLDNTADQILSQYFNGLRLAASFSVDGDGVTQDVDAAEKELMALHDVPNQTMDRVVADFEDTYIRGDQPHSIDQLALAGDFPNVTADKIKTYTLRDGDDGNKYAYITWFNEDNKKVEWVFAWHTFSDIDGNPDGAWVREG
jgi:hypothetical protein